MNVGSNTSHYHSTHIIVEMKKLEQKKQLEQGLLGSLELEPMGVSSSLSLLSKLQTQGHFNALDPKIRLYKMK